MSLERSLEFGGRFGRDQREGRQSDRVGVPPTNLNKETMTGRKRISRREFFEQIRQFGPASQRDVRAGAVGKPP
jgi:hypothetical protein